MDTWLDLALDPFSLTSSSFSLPPVYVPGDQRFVCGFNRCGRVLFNDLKNRMKRQKNLFSHVLIVRMKRPTKSHSKILLST